MALINCPECNKEVSDTALTCPHCGYQLRRTAVQPHPVRKTDRKNQMVMRYALLGVAFLIIIATLINRIDWSSEEQTAPTKVSDNPFIEQWAGYYTIEVKGFSGKAKEKYALRSDGTATWVWTEPDDKGEDKELSRKYGSWTATAKTITTSIRGNTGTLETVYVYNYVVFEEKGNTNRYLKRYKQ